MHRVRLPLLSGLLLLSLACGPRALFTTLFPATYDVAVDLVLTTPDGVVRRSRNVTHCDVIDGSDSYIPPRSVYKITGERNAWALPDGSAMVFARVSPCQWGHRARDHRPDQPLPLVPWSQGRQNVDGQVALHQSDLWRFDDAIDPTRLDRLDAHALMRGSTRGTVSGTIALVDERPTTMVSNILPWIGDPDRDRTSFLGMEATMGELVGLSCDTVDPAGATWVQVNYPDECAKVLSACDEGATNAPCERPLGGLPTVFDADAQHIRFATDAVDPELLGSLRRLSTLPPDAPRSHGGRWSPDLCIDGVCFSGTERDPLVYVLPAKGWRVRVRLNRVDATDVMTP